MSTGVGSLAARSFLGGLLPESLLYVLTSSGPQAFAAAMVGDSDTPELVWTHRMRAQRLVPQMHQHLGELGQRLGQHCHKVWEYVACPPMKYPELAEEMWCHRYYLRNLCDEDRFPNWPIVDHVLFLQVTLNLSQCMPSAVQCHPGKIENAFDNATGGLRDVLSKGLACLPPSVPGQTWVCVHVSCPAAFTAMLCVWLLQHMWDMARPN